MRGIEDFNFPAFHAASAQLREFGWDIYSPAERDESDPQIEESMKNFGGNWSEGTHPLAYFMQFDLAAVCRADAVILLPGWEASQGARLEVSTALEVDVLVFLYDETAVWGVGEQIKSVPHKGSETLPTGSEARKGIPITTGLIDYFPAALAAVAEVSKAGNDKHNPGEPLHWSRGKSMDQADCIGRHLIERGGFDPDTGLRHTAQLAWRALALLQLELEEAGEAPLPRGASV